MKTIHTILLLTAMLQIGCCCSPQGDPQPTKDFSQLVERAIPQWLDPRIDKDTWQIFSKKDAGWRTADSLSDLSGWFELYLGTPAGDKELWNFARLIADLKASELYKSNQPSEKRFLSMLIDQLSAYSWKE